MAKSDPPINNPIVKEDNGGHLTAPWIQWFLDLQTDTGGSSGTGTMATQDASAVAITGGTITGVTWSGPISITDLTVTGNTTLATPSITPVASDIVLLKDGSNSDIVSGCTVSQLNSVAGSWALISTKTASSSATIEFTGLDSSYFIYKIECSAFKPSVNTANFNMRTSSDGGSTWDSSSGHYAYLISKMDTGGETYSGAASNTEMILVESMNAGVSPANNHDGTITIHNPSAALTITQASWELFGVASTGNYTHSHGSGVRVSTTAPNAVQLFMSSGTIKNGTFKLYGLVA